MVLVGLDAEESFMFVVSFQTRVAEFPINDLEIA